MGWQWYQLDQASTSSLIFTGRILFLTPNQQCQSTEGKCLVLVSWLGTENKSNTTKTSFFRLSIHALVAKIWPDKVVRWCRDGDFWRPFCVLYLQRAACSAFQTCILNSH